jgi:hypothetical protein
MVVWSGKGFLSVIVLIFCLFLFVKLMPNEYGDYAFVLAFFITGVFSWFMGKKWNAEEVRTVVDKATGQEIILKPNHSLFWIKLQYWGIIFGTFGLIILIQTLV